MLIKSFITASEASEISDAVFIFVNPAPAFKVSCIWSFVLSSGFWCKTPTIPPWAYLELLSPKLDFVISNIPSGRFISLAIFNAAYIPAAPLPIITTEYSEYFIFSPLKVLKDLFLDFNFPKNSSKVCNYILKQIRKKKINII